QVTDAGLASVADMSNVTRLGLVEEGGGMVITDAGLEPVGRMKQLKSMMLMGMPKITDAGLAHLHGLSNLETLTLRGTGVTAAGLQELMRALPDCRIITDVDVPGTGSVQRIVVRKVASPDEVVAEISAPQRIADIVANLKQLTPEEGFVHLDEPAPADRVLEFVGGSRVLYEVRLGAGSLQKNFPGIWTKWNVTEEQQRE
ncbi:MAG: hypothetical protein WD669_03855, partial [Pirellulales bacterium]